MAKIERIDGPNGRVYIIDGVPCDSVTSPFKDQKKYILDAWKARIGVIAANQITKMAGDFGNELHDLISKIVCGQPVIVPEKYQFYIDQFTEWQAKTVKRVIYSEKFIYDLEHRIAGTVDLYVELVDGSFAVPDVKTGRVGTDTILQLAAYAKMLNNAGRIILPMPRGKEKELKPIILKPETLEEDWGAYLNLLGYWRWTKKYDGEPRHEKLQRKKKKS